MDYFRHLLGIAVGINHSNWLIGEPTKAACNYNSSKKNSRARKNAAASIPVSIAIIMVALLFFRRDNVPSSIMHVGHVCPRDDWMPGFSFEQKSQEQCPARRQDIRDTTVDGQLGVIASDTISAALGCLDRTEDIIVSPDGQRLIVAGFTKHSLTFLKVGINASRSKVEITDVTTTGENHPGLRSPHGVAFLDDSTLIVANRDTTLNLVELDKSGMNLVSWRVLVNENYPVPTVAPGSVFTRALFGSLVEVFVCNNYRSEVVRYVLDKSRDWEIMHAEKIMNGISIPDGVAITSSGEWIAVSNHEKQRIDIFRYTTQLGIHSKPTRSLIIPGYPHGLQFTPDDSTLLVADAGLPLVHSFHSPSSDWSEEARVSKISRRIMDETTFLAGHESPLEGGPKGIAILADQGLVAVTSQFQPLAFFHLETLTSSLNPSETAAINSVRDEDRYIYRLMDEAKRLKMHHREEVDRNEMHRSEIKQLKMHLREVEMENQLRKNEVEILQEKIESMAEELLRLLTIEMVQLVQTLQTKTESRRRFWQVFGFLRKTHDE